MKGRGPLVVGIGNPDRGDDAIGLAVAERLTEDATVMLSGGDPASLIDAWEGWSWVIIVDAVTSTDAPGTVTIRELIDSPDQGVGVHSSHSLGPLEAIAIGEALGVLPGRVTLVGIEADEFGVDMEMSSAVLAAVDKATVTVRFLIANATDSLPPVK